MHAVPIKVGMRRLQMRWAEGFRALHLAHRTVMYRPGALAETQRRRTKDRHTGRLGFLINGQRILQGSRHWLVDEDWFLRCQARTQLLQMHAAIIGFEEDHVHLAEQRRDRVHDLHAHGLHLLDVLRHALCARFNIGASLRISRHHLHALRLGQVLGVQRGGESNGVGGIQANDPSPERLSSLDQGGRSDQS